MRDFRNTLLLLLGLAALPVMARADKSPYDWARVRLDYARREKVEQLRRFLDRIHGLASRAHDDEVLLEFLDVNSKCRQMAEKGPLPAEFVERISDFRRAIGKYYVENYLPFYDMLFVDAEGNLVHSIRGTSQSEGDLVKGDQADTILAACLRSMPQTETFVDFHFCDAADEPAAFFVEPAFRDGQHIGWIVLQCAINKINSLFAGAEQLGATGEAFVVNRDGYMLTESNFQGDSTILKRHLDDRNIRAKFREGHGHRTVTDYRGFTALTSFEVVEFLGTQWLVVAKVDEAQIVTEHYIQHRKYYGERIVNELARASAGPSREPFPETDRKIIRVDMDEFMKATRGEQLRTLGVSTCTALVATYPGKFGYLAHISPMDRIYGAEATNLLGHVTKKIKTYDIYKHERRHVRFVIAAPHLESLTRTVDKLIDEGFFLSQISVLYHPRAKVANVVYDYSEDHISVQWIPRQASGEKIIHHAGDAHNLDTIVKRYLEGENTALHDTSGKTREI